MSHSPSILLVHPSCFYYPEWMERVSPKTSLLWLASYLAQFTNVAYADFEVEIGRPNTTAQIRRYERRVRAALETANYDILAISCWTSLSYQASKTVARISRELFPDKLVVVGGYHPTARPHDFLDAKDLFDVVVHGEGELPLKSLIESWQPGVRPEKPRVMQNYTLGKDDFVNYDWDLVSDQVRDLSGGSLWNNYIYLSRGCPFSCSFCMEPAKDHSWRAFEPETAVEVLFESAARFNSHGIGVADACFGMRSSWRKKFLKALVAAKPDFWVVMETRSEYLDDDDMDLLSELKIEVQLGIESCSQEMLTIMNKTRVPDRYLERFLNVTYKLSERKVLHRANLIFNHPGETRKTLGETYAFMDNILEKGSSHLTWASHGYMDFPGCQIDANRSYYEKTFGARFNKSDWWRREEDQYESCMDVVPSHDLDGERRTLWKEEHNKREEAMKGMLAPEAFKFAAAKYYPEWLEDG